MIEAVILLPLIPLAPFTGFLLNGLLGRWLPKALVTILALGAPAAKTFLGRDFAISKMRGRWYEGPQGIALMATFHPAYLLRQTGGELEAVKRLVWHDLKAVRAKLDETPAAAPPEQASLF